MSQLCFDRSSLIINVVLLCAALEVIVPVSAVPTRAGFDFYTWWEKHRALPPQLTLLPSVYLSISLLLFLSLSELWIVSKGSHCCFHTFVLTHTHTHTLDCLVSLQSRWDTVVGMCHSSIIDQIQLPSSTDHLEIHHCLCLTRTITHPSELACSLTNSSIFLRWAYCLIVISKFIISLGYNYSYIDFGLLYILSTRESPDFPKNKRHSTSIM